MLLRWVLEKFQNTQQEIQSCYLRVPGAVWRMRVEKHARGREYDMHRLVLEATSEVMFPQPENNTSRIRSRNLKDRSCPEDICWRLKAKELDGSSTVCDKSLDEALGKHAALCLQSHGGKHAGLPTCTCANPSKSPRERPGQTSDHRTARIPQLILEAMEDS